MIRLILIILLTNLFLNLKAQLEYISPVPGSSYHNPEATIILRKHGDLDTSAVLKSYFSISSNQLGAHEFDLVFSTDGKTVILRPQTVFSFEDTVNIWIDKAFHGDTVDLNYKFHIRKERASDKNCIWDDQAKDTIPENFPELLIYEDTTAYDSQIFMHNISSFSTNHDRFMTIMNNDGSLVYTKQDDNEGVGFTLQPSGYISYWGPGSFILIDSSYQQLDTFHCMDGYSTDWHEFVHLKNGHAFVINYDPHEMEVVIEGDTLGTSFVEGFVFQELDAEKNVILLWRSWDHFKITDATHTDFTNLLLAYVHGNALSVSNDSNILISSRKLDEITKINRNTGEVIWRFGGKNNQFEMTNDTAWFNRQHHITQLENGNITLFDNGEFHHVKMSFAKEYKLNETNRTAELVWSYHHPDSIFSSKMGSVQRLPNGNTFICWGLLSVDGNPHITEVDSAGNIVYEIKINEDYNYLYRAFRFDWHPSTIGIDEQDIRVNNPVCFPLPADNELFIRTYFENSENTVVRVFDLTGKCRLKQTFNTDLLKINTCAFESGLYIAEISNNKNVHRLKLIISR